MESSGSSVQHQGKIVTDKTAFVCHSNICVKLLFFLSFMLWPSGSVRVFLAKIW